MPNAYKVLGQSLPTANTFTDLYKVPGGASAVLSTLNICNTSAANCTFRVLVRPNSNTITTSQYIAFDTPVLAQDAIALTLGLTLGTNDTITVFSFQGNVTFSLFGTEIT